MRSIRLLSCSGRARNSLSGRMRGRNPEPLAMETITEIRCRQCGKLLAKGRAEVAHIEFKCPRCGAYTILRASRPDHAGRGASPVEAPWPQNADRTIRRS